MAGGNGRAGHPRAVTMKRPRAAGSPGARVEESHPQMLTPTDNKSNAPVTLTEVGRVRAVLARLEAMWPELSAAQQLEAMALIGELAAVYRGRTGASTGLQTIA